LQTAAPSPSITYAAHGAITGVTFGGVLAEARTYNSQLQTTQIQAGSLLTLGYGFSATQNSGNVSSQTINDGVNPPKTQTYTYDAVNRLATASEGSTWSQTYVYDPLGNRALLGTSSDPSTGVDKILLPTTTSTTAVPYTNNQWTGTGVTYDQRGNLTGVQVDAGDSFSAVYDAESRNTSVTTALLGVSETVNYGYDGEGKRVTKSIVGGATIAFVYDAQGQLTQEYGSPADSGTQYLTSDPLGSTRLVSTISGGVASAFNRSDYLPFGQEIPSTWNRSNYQLDTVQRIKFTAKERDSETGLDWFNTRYFSGAQGRFTSPDQPLNDQNPSDPQSWNLYSYVRNNPLKFTDPTGQDCVYTSGASDGTVGLQRGNCTEAGGTFVNGTIDEKSFAYDSKTNSIGYSYTNAAEGTAGAGSIALPDPEDAANRAGAAQIAGSQLIVNEFAKQALYGALGGIAGRAIGFGVEALLAARAARAAEVAVDVANLSNKIVRQMASRGWTAQEIVETVQGGKTSTVLNKATGGTATQYVNAATGKFVVVDNATKQVIQVSGPGFLPNPPIR
jgi:RHS repeat-associated protein